MAARKAPVKLSMMVIAGIAAGKRRGLTFAMSARLSGVTPAACARWMTLGNVDIKEGHLHTKHAQLVAACEHAHAQLIDERLEGVNAATKVRQTEKVITTTTEKVGDKTVITVVERIKQEGADWRADAWLLERQAPEQYGHKVQTEVVIGEGSAKVNTMEDLVRHAFSAEKE